MLDALGNGLSGVQLSVQSSGAARVAADAVSLTAITDDSGGFTVNGLTTGQTYNLTVQGSGRNTLHTTFRVSAAIPNVEIQMVVPEGSKDVTFTMPTPLTMNQPISAQSAISLTWSRSINPGFVAYTVFKSPSSTVLTTDEQLGVTVAAANNKMSDTVLPGQTVYYRLYEKDLIPELGAFILIGSNVVSPVFPAVSSFAPAGQNVGLTTPLQLRFSQPMNHASVSNSLTVSSSVSGETVSGTTSWTDNTLTFTPAPSWKLARTYTVQLSGQDAVGNQLTGTLTFHFSTTYPSLLSFAPTGTDVDTTVPLQIVFATPVDQGALASRLSISSSQPNETVTGTTAWAGNTLTFTPEAGWKLARTYTVTLPGLGDEGMDTLTFTFSTHFPEVSSYSPTGLNLPVDTPVQITLVGPIEHATVAGGLSITSSIDDNNLFRLNNTTGMPPDTIAGTVSWVGDTLQFVPAPAWEYGRNYRVTLTGLGSQSSSLTFMFSTKAGYLFDTAFAATDLGSSPLLTNPRHTVTSYFVDGLDNLLVVDENAGDPYQVLRYNSAGALSGILNIADDTLTVDALNRIWGWTPRNRLLHRYDATGALVATVTYPSLGTTGYSAPRFAVDSGRNLAYVLGDSGVPGQNAVLFSVNLANAATTQLTYVTTGGPSLDSSGSIYVWSDGEAVKLTPSGTVLSRFGPITSHSVGPDDHLYCVWKGDAPQSDPTATPDYLFWKLDSSGHLVTHFRLSGSLLPSLASQALWGMGTPRVDSMGRVYLVFGNQFVRLLPDP